MPLLSFLVPFALYRLKGGGAQSLNAQSAQAKHTNHANVLKRKACLGEHGPEEVQPTALCVVGNLVIRKHSTMLGALDYKTRDALLLSTTSAMILFITDHGDRNALVSNRGDSGSENPVEQRDAEQIKGLAQTVSTPPPDKRQSETAETSFADVVAGQDGRGVGLATDCTRSSFPCQRR